MMPLRGCGWRMNALCIAANLIGEKIPFQAQRAIFGLLKALSAFAPFFSPRRRFSGVFNICSKQSEAMLRPNWRFASLFRCFLVCSNRGRRRFHAHNAAIVHPCQFSTPRVEFVGTRENKIELSEVPEVCHGHPFAEFIARLPGKLANEDRPYLARSLSPYHPALIPPSESRNECRVCGFDFYCVFPFGEY